MSARRPAALVLIFTCAAGLAGGQSRPKAARIVEDTLHAASLERNLYSDSPDRLVLVYLPPSYATNANRRYPVVYLLHGADVGARQWLQMTRQSFGMRSAMDSLVAGGLVREMIVVMPDAHTRFGGSFYANSASAGNWDDFIAKDLVRFIDAKYRTVARPESRGLAGHSMGGYGALTIGMRHAGTVFGAVYSMSPCCTRMTAAAGTAMQAVWPVLAAAESTGVVPDSPLLRHLVALAAALSPDAARPPLFIDLPFVTVDGHAKVVDAVFSRWMANTPYDMLPRYRDDLQRLGGLALDVGTQDQEVSLADVAEFDKALSAAGIAHTFATFDGGHVDHIGVRLTGAVFPFFSRALVFPN
jgi:S-formylglutathione hydrolase